MPDRTKSNPPGSGRRGRRWGGRCGRPTGEGRVAEDAGRRRRIGRAGPGRAQVETPDQLFGLIAEQAVAVAIGHGMNDETVPPAKQDEICIQA